MRRHRKVLIVVAEELPAARNLVVEVLRGAGFEDIMHADRGSRLLEIVEDHAPRIVITASRLPELSGLAFTRMIRWGYKNTPRHLSIIAMTNTPTEAFLEAAQASGVDEMLVRPFAAEAVLLRIRAVLDHPRAFIDGAEYVGPCRRRRRIQTYSGPMRRFVDDTDDAQPWEYEPSRVAVRKCIQKISESITSLSAGDRRKLQQIFNMVRGSAGIVDETRDATLASAARSLGRYILAIEANGAPDTETITMHIDAMHAIGRSLPSQHDARQSVIDGLIRIVNKKLGAASLSGVSALKTG